MNSWSENFYSRLEKIKDQIPKSDFRFYNLGHLPLVVKKTEEFSKQCEACQLNQKILDQLVDMMPVCFEKHDTRRKFEKEKSRIEKHLHRKHQVYYIHFHYSLFSFLGIIAGLIAGIILSLFFLGKLSINYLLIASILGLFFGQIAGKYFDRKKYQNKDQI